MRWGRFIFGLAGLFGCARPPLEPGVYHTWQTLAFDSCGGQSSQEGDWAISEDNGSWTITSTASGFRAVGKEIDGDVIAADGDLAVDYMPCPWLFHFRVELRPADVRFDGRIFGTATDCAGADCQSTWDVRGERP